MELSFAAQVAAAAEEMRRKQEGQHTREIRVESLPKEVQELLLEMADKINALTHKVIDLERTVASMGQVTLNDLMKRSA